METGTNYPSDHSTVPSSMVSLCNPCTRTSLTDGINRSSLHSQVAPLGTQPALRRPVERTASRSSNLRTSQAQPHEHHTGRSVKLSFHSESVVVAHKLHEKFLNHTDHSLGLETFCILPIDGMGPGNDRNTEGKLKCGTTNLYAGGL
jgi:hypothetical protein